MQDSLLIVIGIFVIAVLFMLLGIFWYFKRRQIKLAKNIPLEIEKEVYEHDKNKEAKQRRERSKNNGTRSKNNGTRNADPRNGVLEHPRERSEGEVNNTERDKEEYSAFSWRT